MRVLGMVKAFFEALGEVFNPAPRNSQDSFPESSESLGPSDRFENPGEWFWKDVLMQKVEESEREKEMMIEDYESRHEVEAVQEDSGNAETGEGSSEADSAETDSGQGIDDSSEGSGGYDGYIV